MTREALELLAQSTHAPDLIPAQIERLNLCAFDVSETIRDLQDEATTHEEDATAEASAESNDAKRRARRAELLREDAEYHALLSRIRVEARELVRLQERSYRLARELRLHIATQTAQVL